MVGEKDKIAATSAQKQAGTGIEKYALLALALVILAVILFIFESEILALVLPHLSYDGRKSVAFYTNLFQLISSELFWYAGFIMLFVVIGANVPPSYLTSSIGRSSSIKSAFTVMVSALMMTLVIVYFVFDRFPNSGDEYVYLFQARTMASGQLWEKAHELPQFFHFNHIAQKDGIIVGRFPPGWPAILALAFYADIPASIVNPIFAVIALAIYYTFARRQYSNRVAFCALVALAFTSYFLYFSASYFSHISCMVAILAFVACLYRYMDTRAAGYLAVAGLFLGVAAIIRPFTAFLIFLPFLPMLIARYRRKSLPMLFWIGIGALPGMIFLLWYNYAITGDPLLPVTKWTFPNEGLGFVKGHTPLKGVEHLVRQAGMFLYWSSPALLILYIIYLLQKLMNRTDRLRHVEDYAFACLAIGHFFYYEIGGDQYGPRFLLEGLPFLVLFVTRSVLASSSHRATALFVAGCIYAVVKIPVVSEREQAVVKERTDLYRQVAEHDLKDAVVLLSSYVGDIRPMPVGDLTRNDPLYDTGVLFALDIPGQNAALFEYYPRRDFYRYEWLQSQGKGRLVKLDSRR